MMYCSNCGTKLKDDDVFCSNCGAKVNGGNNPQQKGGGQSINVPNINTEVVSRHSKQVINIVKGMLIKPISSIKEISNEVDKKATLILGAALAILQGIFSMWFLSHGISLVEKTISEISGFGSFFSGAFSGTKEALKLPYGQSFIHGIILALVTFGVLYLGILIVSNLIFKTSTNSLALLNAVILSTIPTFGGEFLFLLLSYVSLTVAIFVLLIGIFISFATFLIGVKNLINVSENALIFSVSIVFTIMLGCIAFVMWKFFLMDVESIQRSFMDTKSTKDSLMDIFK